jgi:hypothetical protein
MLKRMQETARTGLVRPETSAPGGAQTGDPDAPLALALAQVAPDRGAGAGCQQPGSPGCPQQDCRCAILVNVLAKSRRSFQPKGPGWVRLAHPARGEDGWSPR